MPLVVSASLHPESRSRILANVCSERLVAAGRTPQFLDLAKTPLPFCDGATAYEHANVVQAAAMIGEAPAVFIAAPVYNYDVNATAKNLVELTGRSWTGKVIGLLLAAGGQGSYMAGLGIANSLMLDFRCIIVPRFLYATGQAFDGNRVVDPTIDTRLDQLVDQTLRISDAVQGFENA